ncbi:MAG: thiaminase II, partial [Alphaproteobacteria bacterium]
MAYLDDLDLFPRLRNAAGDAWSAYVAHPFVAGLADGSLPETSFRHYLGQDYLFLIHFARAYALAVYKADTLAEIRNASAGMSAIVDTE